MERTQVPKRSTGRSTIIVFMLTTASSFLGFGRESYIAYVFGATGLTDAFYVASVVPDMIGGVLASTLTNAIMPTLKREIGKSRTSSRTLASLVVMYSSLVLAILSATVFFHRYEIVKILAPGFSSGLTNHAGSFLGTMSLSVVFTGVAGTLWGIHNAYDSFAFPAMAGLAYNVCVLGFSVTLVPIYGVYALCYAFLIGSIGRFLIQLIPSMATRQIGFPKRIWHSAISETSKLMPPTLFSAGFGSVSVIVDRVLASGLPPGQITGFSFAAKLGLLPVAILGMSLATTLYARFIQHSIRDEMDDLKRMIKTGATWAVFLGLVLAAPFGVSAVPLVSILFMHGHFNATDVRIASGPLRVYGYFMIFYLLQPVLLRFFYARKDNRFVTVSSLLSVGANIMLSILLIKPFGILGLALANGISQCMAVSILMFMVGQRLRWDLWRPLLLIIVQGFPPAIAFILGFASLCLFWRPQFPSSWLIQSLDLIVSGFVGIIGLLMFALLVKRNPISQLILGVVRRRRLRIAVHEA